ncbi:inner centromere protein A-like isoform X2 [Homarus americanus]|uniref:inner centromere protein A-like isoform X2 n=1 Tax=Homarus americanus TaxID=6706 RepID=UPI001C490AD9|nr:inner centromere protein A-like isoform X2 [Homarus americanus]
MTKAAMEQQYKEKRRGSNTCLVCGRQGGNTIVVTSVHSFVSASGTPLADFLVKVVGEDPCYSVSEVICQQCFVLLDRLDAYQARAAEIHTHVTSRYRDTKLELLGQRQRMSELIASSLSNVQELRHGTTLNVSDELTITVVHEALPRKRRKYYRLENGSTAKSKANVVGANNLYSARNDPISQYISKKIKRKRVPKSSSDSMYISADKKKKLTGSGHISVSNNNNLTYANCVKNWVGSEGSVQCGAGRTVKRKPPQSEVDLRNSSTEEELSDDASKGKPERKAANEEEEEDEEEEEEEDEQEEGGGVEELEEGEEQSDAAEEAGKEDESSDDDSSSDSDDDDGSASEQEEDAKSEVQSWPEMEQQRENDNEEEDEEEEEEAAGSGEERDPQHQSAELTVSKPSPNQTKQQRSKPQIKPAQPPEVQNKLVPKVEPSGQIQLPPETSESMSPQVAEAMLMQSPLATSLLQSFLATSLWFGSPDTSKKKKSGGQTKQKQQHQVPDDVTSETLAVTAGSTKDKKKRQELKNTGQSYINTKGKLVDAKRVWPQDCSRCPLKCNARISEEDRLKIFAEYWGLADYNLQREYLAAHMQREEKLGPSGLLRTVILYFLTCSNNTKLQVCRQFFLKTLDVSEKASRIVLEKMVRGELGSEGGAATPPPGITRPQSSQEDLLSSKNGDETNLSNEEDETKSEGSS